MSDIKALARIFLPTRHRWRGNGGEIRARQVRSNVRATLGALSRFLTSWTWRLGFGSRHFQKSQTI
jgi:hypothetical protein